MTIDIIEHSLHIFNGLVNSLLLRHHLLLPSSAHQRGLFDHAHHLLLLVTGDDLLLAVRVLQDELARRGLDLVVGSACLFALFVVRVVIAPDESNQLSVETHNKVLRVLKGKPDIDESPLTTELLPRAFDLVVFLLRVVHLHKKQKFFTFFRDATLGEVERLHRGRTVKSDKTDILRRVDFCRICDDIEHSDESLANHEVGDEVVGQAVVDLVLQKLDQLAGFEGGVVVDSDAKLELLAAIHNYHTTYYLFIKRNNQGIRTQDQWKKEIQFAQRKGLIAISIMDQQRNLDYVQRHNSNASLTCNYLPMSVGWQPDLLTLSQQIQRYDYNITLLETRIKEMAKLAAHVANKVGLPFQNFLQQQGLGHLIDREVRAMPPRNKKIHKKNRSPEYRKQVMQKWAQAEKQGLSVPRFCVLNGVSQRTLRRWITNK